MTCRQSVVGRELSTEELSAKEWLAEILVDELLAKSDWRRSCQRSTW